MNKIILVFSLISSFVWATSVEAAATHFSSPNYVVQSVIVGGTGILDTGDIGIPPIITTSPSVSGITTSSATISWGTNVASNSIVEYGTTSNLYSTQLGQVTTPIYLNHAVVVPTLVKGTTYFYRVISQDVFGNTVQSVEQTFVTDPGDITPPAVTDGPAIANNSATSITITWTTNKLSNGVVKFGLHATTENTVGNPDDQTLFHQVQLNGLVPSQAYVFSIQSKDQSGNIYLGSQQSFTTLTAPSITGVKISDITLNSALLQWQTTSPSTTVVNYGTSSNYGQNFQDTSSYTTNHLVRLQGLASGTEYRLRIKGSDQGLNAFTSDEYTFQTVILPTIDNLKISEVDATSAKLDWTSSSDIDQLIHLEITASFDPKLVGKKTTVGDEKLVASHEALLSDLASNSTYVISVIGKDQFGNQAVSPTMTIKTLVDSVPAAFTSVTTDTTVDLGSKQSVQVLVSVGLSKPAITVIEYGAGASKVYDHKVTTDTDLSTNKLLVIPGLVPGQSYHFHIIATTASGIKSTSGDSLVLAPTQPLSLTDLIFSQLQTNLGWIGKL